MRSILKTVIVLLIFINITSIAQTKIGFQMGVSSSALRGADVSPDADLERNNSFTIGALFYTDIYKSLSLRLEPQYIIKGDEFKQDLYNEKIQYETELSYIDIPVYIALEFNRNKYHPYLFAGLNLGFLVDVNLQLNNTINSFHLYDKDKFSDYNLSAEGGLGFSYRLNGQYEVQLNLKYSYGLVNIYTKYNSIKTSDYQANIGVLYSIL